MTQITTSLSSKADEEPSTAIALSFRSSSHLSRHQPKRPQTVLLYRPTVLVNSPEPSASLQQNPTPSPSPPPPPSQTFPHRPTSSPPSKPQAQDTIPQLLLSDSGKEYALLPFLDPISNRLSPRDHSLLIRLWGLYQSFPSWAKRPFHEPQDLLLCGRLISQHKVPDMARHRLETEETHTAAINLMNAIVQHARQEMAAGRGHEPSDCELGAGLTRREKVARSSVVFLACPGDMSEVGKAAGRLYMENVCWQMLMIAVCFGAVCFGIGWFVRSYLRALCRTWPGLCWENAPS